MRPIVSNVEEHNLTSALTSRQGSDPTTDDIRLLVDSVRDYAIFLLDPNGNILTWNRGAERIKGYSPDEIIGRHFSTFYPSEDVAAGKPEEELRVAVRDARVEVEGWRLRKDGSRFWANVIITTLYDAHGQHRGFGEVTRDLTERRTVAEELHRAEERLRLLIESIGDYAIYMLDPGGHVSTWNTGAEKIKGYAASEIVGKHYSTFFTAEDVEAKRPDTELWIARSTGRYEEEGWRVRKDGTRFWANVILTAICDSNGKLLGFAKVTRDLSSRQSAERTALELAREQAARAAAELTETALRDERERYKTLSRRLEVILEGIIDGITVQDRSGRVIFANTTAALVCGFKTTQEFLNATPAEVVERFEIFDEEGNAFDPHELPGRRVLAGADSAGVTLRVRERATGHGWWSLIRAKPVRSATGEVELAVNIWHDVTEDRRREEHERYLARATATLSSSLDYESMLRSLAELLVSGLTNWCSINLLVDDKLQNVVIVGEEAHLEEVRERATQYRADSARSRGLWEVVRTGKSALYESVSDEFLQAMAQDERHLRLLRALGMRSIIIVPIRIRDRVSGTISLMSTAEGRSYDHVDVALAEEIGRRAGTTIENAKLFADAKVAAKAAAEAARAAEEASRIKDEFLATVSHELRTPLNSIVGWSAVLRERTNDPAILKGVDIIHRNADAQGKLIEDILDVSRIITGKLRLDLKPTDLLAVVHDAVEAVRPSATAKHIAIDLAEPVEPCLLVADPERVQQVVWNLLSNAVNFTDSGGSIKISIAQEKSQLALTVEDTGRGIDPSFLPYVFDRFKQADASSTRSVGGLGLGLAIVRHIIEIHGGHVSASSPGLGKGATFSIYLPIRAVTSSLDEEKRASSQRRGEEQRTETRSIVGLRVLVVDDEPDARELLETLLEGGGAVVETAESAGAAFELLEVFRPDILVSDIGMPEQDGYGLMQRIRALEPAKGGDLPSIALTAYTRSEDKAKAMSAGFTTHIAKPVKPEDLLSAIKRVARRDAR